MSDFERDVVQCFNRFFEQEHIKGFAYRLKQHKFSAQYIDVLVDSLDPRYYLALECKSIRGKKLYFSQHFHTDKNQIHQIDAISSFLRKTGRSGYLAVEFRFGSGRTREAYLMPWQRVQEFYAGTQGVSIDEFRQCLALKRSSEGYELPDLNPQ
jgi:Holliday junction resolvase